MYEKPTVLHTVWCRISGEAQTVLRVYVLCRPHSGGEELTVTKRYCW